jgi:hypothetical protein
MPSAENGESRLDRIERMLEEMSVRGRENQEVFRVNIESLHASLGELHELAQANERAIAAHNEQLRLDAEHIRALVRIAEIHDRRISGLEGDEQS